MSFKVGDKVRCVDTCGIWYYSIEVGGEYVVKEVKGSDVVLKIPGQSYAYPAKHFELATLDDKIAKLRAELADLERQKQDENFTAALK